MIDWGRVVAWFEEVRNAGGRGVSTSLEETGEEVMGLFEGPYLGLGALLTKYSTTTGNST